MNRYNYFLNKQLSRIDNYIHINYKKGRLEGSKHLLDSHWTLAFESLNNNGFAKLPFNFKFINEYDFNFENIKNKQQIDNKLIFQKNLPTPNNFGKSSTSISLNSEFFSDNIFTKELFILIKSYFKRDFWLRNSPTIMYDLNNFRNINHTQEFYHLDWCDRQLTLVVLLNDIDLESTHLKYVPQTNRKSWILLNENRQSEKFSRITDKYIKKYGVIPVIGKKGDVFIFDAGNGLHKASYGKKDRGIINIIFSIKRTYAHFNENYEKKNNLKQGEHYWRNKIEYNILEKYNKNLWEKSIFKYVNW